MSRRTKTQTLQLEWRNFFCASGYSEYNDHNNLDHSYTMNCYLNINIKNNVYNNSRTPVNCAHTTPVVTA
jgi:hypothetical protein